MKPRTKSVAGAIVLTLVTIAALLIPALPVATAFPGTNGSIVFERRGDIITVNADGSGEVNLTENDPGNFSFRDPNWSADGSRIVMSDGYDLWTMYSDGTGLTQITTGQSAGVAPVWSPDGTKIAFQYGDGRLGWLNADGTDQQTLASGTVNNDPAWSPDGTKLAFARISGGGSGRDLYVATIDSDGLVSETNLTSTPNESEEQPKWSPDGTKLTFIKPASTPGGFIFNVHSIDVGSGSITRLTTDNEHESEPGYSPDGSQIVFVGRDPSTSSSEIWVADADGSSADPITSTGPSPVVHEAYPDWGVQCTSNCSANDQGGDGGGSGGGGGRPPECDTGEAICGDDGDNELQGTPEDDTIYAGEGNDTIDGGGGDDVLIGAGGDDVLTGGDGNDVLIGDEQAASPSRVGSRFDLTFLQEDGTAPPGNDTLDGGAGNDVVDGSAGNDQVKGGAGVDEVVGGAGKDRVTGQAGGDDLAGSGGPDFLNGGGGVDDMNGGPGKDTCVLDTKKERSRTDSCEKKKLNFKLNFLPLRYLRSP